jgi:hypothetical protein
MSTSINVHAVTKLTTFKVEDDQNWISIDYETDSGDNGSITFFPSTLTNADELLQLLKVNIDCDLGV